MIAGAQMTSKNHLLKLFFFSICNLDLQKNKVLRLVIFSFSLIPLIILKAKPEHHACTYLQVEEQLCLLFHLLKKSPTRAI